MRCGVEDIGFNGDRFVQSFMTRDLTTFDLQNAANAVREAKDRITGFISQTPVAFIGGETSKFGSARVHLKLENLQKTGSFKVRGAANRIFALGTLEASRGVVTSSTGNHGLGVTAAAQERGIDVEVFVSPQVSPKKRAAMEAYGARLRVVGNNPLEAELVARAAAHDSGRTYVPPYNDPLVIAGQGTIALELMEQVPQIDAIYVAVGGGGLISGVGSYLKSVSPQTEVIGCWPENSRVLYESLNVGSIIDFPEKATLSESTAGGVEPRSITFEICQKVVRRHLLVPETEILNAMRWAKTKGWTVEGAAGVAIAATTLDASRLPNKNVVVVICGGNLSPEVAKQVE
jgi:threonine dehydratase